MYHFVFVIVVALAIRSIISTWGYSGHDKPPMFGDFEGKNH